MYSRIDLPMQCAIVMEAMVCAPNMALSTSLDPSAIHSAMLRWRLGTTMLWCVHQNQVHHVEFLSIAMCYGVSGDYGVCTKNGMV